MFFLHILKISHLRLFEKKVSKKVLKCFGSFRKSYTFALAIGKTTNG